MGPLLHQWGARTSNRFPCSLSKEGQTGSLYGVRVGVRPWVRLEGWLRCFAHSFGGVEYRGMHSTLLLLPALQIQQLGFVSLCILLSIICPNCACTQLFLVPYNFFVFCCSRRHLSRCKHCSKRSQVPACHRIRQIYLRTQCRSKQPLPLWSHDTWP